VALRALQRRGIALCAPASKKMARGIARHLAHRDSARSVRSGRHRLKMDDGEIAASAHSWRAELMTPCITVRIFASANSGIDGVFIAQNAA